MSLVARGRRIDFPRRPLIMGILNINDDSFCADGSLDPRWALDRIGELTRLGADIIDVGAESARTNREPVTEDEEVRRLLPVVRGFGAAALASAPRDGSQVFPPLLSINTWRPGVAARVLPEGGDILNDMGALPTDANARIAAAHSAALLIMHSMGEPKQKHTTTTYPDILATLEKFFPEKMAMACSAGLAADAILLDPGIDFAKQAADNLRIYRECRRLAGLGRPVLLPVSRKSVIGRTLGIADPNERDPATAASIVSGTLRGASLFRVHNVEMAWRTLVSLEPFRACP